MIDGEGSHAPFPVSYHPRPSEHHEMKKTALLLCALSAVLFTTGVSAADFGADRHQAKGLNCASCHGPDSKNPAYPDEKTCLQCHNRDELAKKTESLEINPHKAPHNGDCTLCHMQHEPEVNYCAQCHKVSFKMKHE